MLADRRAASPRRREDEEEIDARHMYDHAHMAPAIEESVIAGGEVEETIDTVPLPY